MFDPPEPPVGFRSRSSRVMTNGIHAGICATSIDSRPNGIDFECGFQSNFPSGTRSRVRRVRGLSASSSARNHSVIFTSHLRSDSQVVFCLYCVARSGTMGHRNVNERMPASVIALSMWLFTLQAGTASTSNDRLAAVKALYAAADHEAALIVLATEGVGSATDQYRALCLFALGRLDEVD